MISESYIKDLLLSMGYIKKNHIYEKFFPSVDCYIKVDLKNRTIIYPEDRGMTISNRTTCNFSAPENFVVLECVTRLFDKGYRPEHLNLEKEWTLGHESKGGRADICVSDQEGNTLFIVECKTYGREYEKEYKNIVNDGGQLFSYWQQERSCKFLVLYASKYEGKQIKWDTESIDCSDDANIVALSQKDDSIKLFKNAHTVSELYSVWDETYEKRFSGDVIFRDDSSAYQIGVKPLRKADLKDFADNNKIVNKFEEILRHNNVSDKENAFNRLVALFICKLVDEIQKDMEEIVDFQYKVGTDTYESLQDRLQRLHKEGMEKFMKEEIFYVPDDYAENLVRQYTGQERKNMIAHLKHTLRILKFYTNNDFAFKDVHNEQLFLQNGKILVEVVQLFEKFRIIGSENLQMLGDLFEQLLSKGFKQNEGQFFTPVPITRFIWNSLPVEKILKTEEGAGLPKIIDYACGAGHFLTEGFEAVSACVKANDSLRELDRSFAENNIFGIEKDYRLARVSKISLFMHGAGEGNIIFGDGLENYPDKNIKPNTFDILVANPPYSVSAFKPHLKLKNNSFSILDTISNNGSEIETLFVERISQLLKPNAVAAVILPSSILNKENESFICARESILKNFKIRAIVLMGNKTFGATGTNTVVLFLEKYNEPPKKADLIEDSIDAVFNGCNLDGWEDKAILEQYLKKIDVSSEVYERFLSEAVDIGDIEDKYFLKYKEAFLALSKTKEKQKQKTFGKLSEKEQKKLLTKQYYQYVKKIEREKMKYFSFVYDQRTLIVAAPDDNKGQEKFLGYKWSNRKGQEGIQIIDEGGMLYDAENRMSDRTIASLIRKMFNGEEVSLDDLEEYYYYLHTKDMISFSEVYFNKAIKTTKTRLLKDDPGLTVYSLSNEKTFDITIGDRVLSEEIVSGGRVPVYSANVYEEFGRIDKENMKDYSRPSVIWGIDGDWMVNIIPAGVPFYPTDHCGVLRIKTEKILPEYMMYALQAEGEYERFSRNNRASAQRIRSLVVQAPETKIQKNIIDELKALDDKINGQNAEIEKYENSIRTKFDQIFHLEEFISDGVFSKYEGYSVEDLCIDGRGRVINQQYIENHKGPYPVYSSQTTNDGIFGSIDTFDFDGEYITWTTDGAKAGTVFYRNGKFNCTNVCGTLKSKNDKVNMRYLAYLLNRIAYKFVSRVGNNKLMNDAMKKIVVPVPKRQLQDEFADFVQSVEKSKFECIGKKEKFEIEKDTFVHKYFR